LLNVGKLMGNLVLNFQILETKISILMKNNKVEHNNSPIFYQYFSVTAILIRRVTYDTLYSDFCIV